MFYEKKKKVYSEVSDTKKNINSDYYNMFQTEFKKMFPTNEEMPNGDMSNEEVSNEEVSNEKIPNEKIPNEKMPNIKLTNDDIVFINLFSKYIKNK